MRRRPCSISSAARLFAQGELGESQLARLDKMLARQDVTKCAKRVVYLHHHPFDPRFLHELKDSAELGEILRARGNVDALLYGHNHEGRVRNGKWAIPRCYDAGSATHKNGDPGFHRVIGLARDARWDYDGNFLGPRQTRSRRFWQPGSGVSLSSSNGAC